MTSEELALSIIHASGGDSTRAREAASVIDAWLIEQMHTNPAIIPDGASTNTGDVATSAGRNSWTSVTNAEGWKMTDWETIDTAPRDGTRILGWRADQFGNQLEIWQWSEDSFSKRPRPLFRSYGALGVTHDRANQPTHWMPLPIGPALNAAQRT
jgi:hypothetical protein